MATRLSGQTSIFGVIFFVFKSLLGIERQKKLRKFTFFTRKPRRHVRILIYRTSPIVCANLTSNAVIFKRLSKELQMYTSLLIDFCNDYRP